MPRRNSEAFDAADGSTVGRGRAKRLERPERSEREPESPGQRIEDRLLQAAEEFEAGEDPRPDPEAWQARFDALEEAGPRELPERLEERLEEAGITVEIEIGDDSYSKTITGPDGQVKSKAMSLSEDGQTLLREKSLTTAEGESRERALSITVEDDVVTTTTAGTTFDGVEYGYTAVKVFGETGYEYSLSGAGRGGESFDVAASVDLVNQIVTLSGEEGEVEIPFDQVSEYIDELMDEIPMPIPPVDDVLIA